MKSHNSKYKTGIITAIVIVLVLLIIRFPIGMSTSGDTPHQFELAGQEVRTEPRQESVDFLTRYNNALVDLAEVSKPTVVMVAIERTVAERSPRSLFEEFFRDHPFFRERQPEERERQQRGLGSGVIVSEDGYILTNHHVIAQAETITITLIDEEELPATVVGSDPRTDVAVLKIDAENLPHMPLGDSEELRVGEKVLAIGSPLGPALAHSVTKGIVSQKGRTDLHILGAQGYENFIQTDAAINLGNSGGPLVNMRGELVGINTAIASRGGGFQGIGFSIPSNMARDVMESIIEKGRVVRGFIGISFQPVDERLAQALDLPEARGVVVADIAEDSPAEEAGIQIEDVILEFDGQAVESGHEFRRKVAERAPGTEVVLTVFRDGDEIEVSVILDELPTEELAALDEDTARDILGFSVIELTRELAERLGVPSGVDGVVVEEVDPDSEAADNGLRQGDVILSLNRMPVSSLSEFEEAVSNLQPGEVLLLQILRRGNQFFIAFELQTT